MRDQPPVARRALASALVLGLLTTLMPAAAVAQEGPMAVGDAFEADGDASEATAEFEWTITTPDALWRLEATGPEGEHVRLRLSDEDGLDVGSSASDRAALRDLALGPGTYWVEVYNANREDYLFDLVGSIEPSRFDPEPNDRLEQPVPITDDVPVSGRLAQVGGDTDHFELTVPAGDDMLRDITLVSDSEKDRQLCLMTPENESLQCRKASELPLRDLALDPGRYIVRVSGSVDEDSSYELLVDRTRARSADYETEPNDDFITASPVDAALGVRGRSHYRDVDTLALEVTDEPQLWHIEVNGPQIDYLYWVRAGNDVIARSSPGCDGTAAVLEDLFLVPGTHRFLLRACEGDYEFTATPMGLRDPEAEREPNSDRVRAEPYALGERRVGRVASTEDYDYFRFTLAAPELLEFRLQQPPDADMRASLITGGSTIDRIEAKEPGTELTSQLFLQPGDYLLELRALAPSDGEYELTTTPLDAWNVPADAEPNNEPGYARAIPSSLRWSGEQVLDYDSLDAVWLPALTVPGPLRISVDNERPWVRIYHGPNRDTRVEAERQEDGSFVAADAPLDVPLYLEVGAEGAYEAVVEAPGWTPAAPPETLPVAIELVASTDVLAAYWPEGQRVDAAISLTNEGDEPLDLGLETRTSHYAWELKPESVSVSLEPGASASIPAVIETRADLWAAAPVRLYATAVAADGGFATGEITLDAGRDADAVDPHLDWPVPVQLTGGLNVAGAALAGVPAATVHAEREPYLYDDVTPAGSGFGVGHDDGPLDLIVDLAGDEPVPVAGTILNPLARGSAFEYVPRDFELALSTDGQTWQTVLRDVLTPLPIDQSFVLDAVVDATHARLRIETTYGSSPALRSVSLGEWKVIASPGALPDDVPANIAEPVRGGHLVRVSPFFGNPARWSGVLDDDLGRQYANRDREGGETLDLVIGFQEGRAAQIDELRWRDPEGSRDEDQIDEVDVQVTTGGPLGPWRSLGTWSLERAADGTVAPFVLSQSEWARYVRLLGPALPEERRTIEFPAKVEVLERSTDEEYLSILGEWGYTSDRGPFELLVPSVVSGLELAVDAGDTLESATPLELAQARIDRAEILEDIDWYRVDVPAGSNALTFDLEGIPTVGVGLDLFDADGQAHDLRLERRDQGREHYAADVDPGTYYLKVEQPPFNVAFTFDTSGSMGPYLDFVLEGVRVFASDVQPGREVAMIFPIDRQPLLDTWQDQPLMLEEAVNDYFPQNESSNIEIGLLDSASALSTREGIRAILAVADAETGTFAKSNEVWSAFSDVSPTVYTVHVGAESQPEETRNLMRGWSDTNAGVYSYPTTHAEMERAFERMSTHLRRPSTYALTAATEFVDRRPAALSVVAPVGEPLGLAAGAGLSIILDTSGSMNKWLDGKRRIDVAKESMKTLIKGGLAEDLPVSLRVFGGTGRKTGCETRQLVPLGPLDRAATVKLINKLKIDKKTGTPIAAALRWVKRDLEDVDGDRVVVLITDGKATCKADPEEALAELRDEGIEVSLNIVGFALDDDAVKEQMQAWALDNAGNYYDAADGQALTEAVALAVAAPVDIYAAGADEPTYSTTVGAPPLELPPGTYRLEVRSDPPLQIESIILAAGQDLTHTLEVPG